jgi:hypothetical protein
MNDDGDIYCLDFKPVEIKKRKSVNVVALSAYDFQPDALVIPEHIAQYFCIEEFRINEEKQDVPPVPAMVFGLDLHSGRNATQFANLNVALKPCPKGAKIVLRITNIHRHPHTFNAIMLGTILPTDLPTAKQS